MRNTYTRDSTSRGSGEYGNEPLNAGYDHSDYNQRAWDEESAAGFTRHQPSNSRRTASQNPFAAATKRIGENVSNLFDNRSRRGREVSGRPSRTAPATEANGDYLGVGLACRACGKPVDSAQMRCPHCGAFVKPLYQNILFWISVVVLIALVVVLAVVINSCRADTTQEEDSIPDETTQQPAENDSAPIDRATLSLAVDAAQAILNDQSVTHTYTRYSATVLQAAVDNANSVLLDEAVTDAQITEAYEQLTAANDTLAKMTTEAQSVDYADLSANLSSYIGQRITLTGTALIVTPNDNGSVSVQMAVSGNSDAIVYVDYLPEDALSDLAVGNSFTVIGTVSNEAYGSPVIQADRIEVQ